MKSLGGYVIFWRAAMESPIFDDDWLWRLFCWCVFKANFEDDRFMTQVVPRGQFVTGKVRAAEELGVSPAKWFRGMDKLVEFGAITKTANSKWTTVTVCNYERYQDRKADKRTASEPPANRQRTASGTNKNTSNTSNESKEPKDAAGYSAEFQEFWSVFPPLRRTKKAKAFAAWSRAIERAAPEVILEAVRAFAAAPVAKSQFCPGPEPWLNGDCWEDSRDAWQDDGARHNGKPATPPPVAQRSPTDEDILLWDPRS